MTGGTPAEAAPDPRIGMLIEGRYRIIRPIGEGGMGAVYEGEHVAIKRRVAIKCLHAQFASNAEVVGRFHREAMAANEVRHENIVEVTDLGTFDDGTVYMVLEFLEGHELAHLVESGGPLTLARTVHIMDQACDALGAAHAKGIVHRDLKPENIFLVTRRGDPDFVKVLDFGIAKFLEKSPHAAKTQTGMSVGTPYYMSPEQAEGRKGIDGRADIYSLGVILFHLLTGRFPFEADTIPMLFVKIISAPPPSMLMHRPDLPDAVDGLVTRMLSKNPDDRPATMADVKVALAAFAGDTSTPKLAEVGMLATMAAGEVIESGARPSAEPASDIPSTQQLGTPEDWKSEEAEKARAASAADAVSKAPKSTTTPNLMVIGGVLAILGLGGLVVALATGAFGRDAPEPPTSGDTVPAAAAVGTVAISINIGPDPELVRVTVDGARVENGALIQVPAGQHSIVATREGYEPFEWSEEITFAQTFNRTLHPVGAAVPEAEAEADPDEGEAEGPGRRAEREDRRPSMMRGAMASAMASAEDEATPPPTVTMDEPAAPAMADPPAMVAPTMSQQDGLVGPNLLGT
ncbi:MAG: serine/threonine protein kinase [Deltaproteobacteria bacterium]|nr:MAG: serine/threonine protein kinase [Deltaproteobacteria bacterium]